MGSLLVDLAIADELETVYRRPVEYPQTRRYAAKVDRQGSVDAIVAATPAGRADFLVTLDRHLLDLAAPPAVIALVPQH